jgi:hypothetical protein
MATPFVAKVQSNVRFLNMTKQNRIRNVAILRTFDESGKPIGEHRVSYDEFYGGSVQLIDSSRFRAQKKIRRIEGEIFDSDGNLQQEFWNDYDAEGKHTHGKAKFRNGTITQD